MPPNARAIEQGALEAERLAPKLVPRLEGGLRYIGTKAGEAAGASSRIVKRAAQSPILRTGFKVGGAAALVGGGIYGGLTLGAAGVSNIRAAFDGPPTAPGAIPLLAPGVDPAAAQAYLDYQKQKDAMDSDPAHFLTSWKGLLVIGLVGAIVLVYLMKRGK